MSSEVWKQLETSTSMSTQMCFLLTLLKWTDTFCSLWYIHDTVAASEKKHAGFSKQLMNGFIK